MGPIPQLPPPQPSPTVWREELTAPTTRQPHSGQSRLWREARAPAWAAPRGSLEKIMMGNSRILVQGQRPKDSGRESSLKQGQVSSRLPLAITQVFPHPQSSPQLTMSHPPPSGTKVTLSYIFLFPNSSLTNSFNNVSPGPLGLGLSQVCVFWFPTKGSHGPFSQPDISLSSSLTFVTI